jgi:hypothetical protein
VVQVRPPEPVGIVQGPERGRWGGVGEGARMPRRDLRLDWECGWGSSDLRRARWPARLPGGLLQSAEVEAERGHGARGQSV